jgi:hypothetical protein
MQGSMTFNQACIAYHKKAEKKSAKININLSFSMDEWQQVEKENEDEIRIQGRMFDIKSIRFEHDRVCVYGHFDTKEDHLIAKSKEDHKKGEQKKNSNPDQQTLFFQDLPIVESAVFTIHLKRDYPLLKQFYWFQYLKTENPPPQQA